MLLQLLGQDLCRRVNSHLEQALILLDLVLTHAKARAAQSQPQCWCMVSVQQWCLFDTSSRRLELSMG